MSADTFFTCKARRPDFKIEEHGGPHSGHLSASWTDVWGCPVSETTGPGEQGYNARMSLILESLQSMDKEEALVVELAEMERKNAARAKRGKKR